MFLKDIIEGRHLFAQHGRFRRPERKGNGAIDSVDNPVDNSVDNSVENSVAIRWIVRFSFVPGESLCFADADERLRALPRFARLDGRGIAAVR